MLSRNDKPLVIVPIAKGTSTLSLDYPVALYDPLGLRRKGAQASVALYQTAARVYHIECNRDSEVNTDDV